MLMEIKTLQTPCCDKEIEFQAVLGITEWASNVPQWDFFSGIIIGVLIAKHPLGLDSTVKADGSAFMVPIR